MNNYSKSRSLLSKEKLEAIRESDRKYQAKKRKLHPELKRLETLKYKERFPKQWFAVQKVRNAIKYGKLKRMPCEVCGEIRSQAHHPNYDKPLEVKWLCPSHHKLAHIKS